MKHLRRWVAIAMLAALCFGGLFVVHQRSGRGIEAMRITAVTTVDDIEEVVLATGILKPAKMVAVGAQVSGHVTKVHVTVGQQVRQGERIAQIDATTRTNDLRSAEADLQNILAQQAEKEANLRLAEASVTRQRTTLAQSASSRADYETAEANLRQVQAQLRALEARIEGAQVAIETARTNLAYTQIHTPIAGTVMAVVTQEGQTVNAVQSAPTIAIIGQLETMQIRVDISEVDVVKVQPGQVASFKILGAPEQMYGAVLEAVEPAPESIKNDTLFSSSSAVGSTSTTTSTNAAIYYTGILRTPNALGRLRTYMTVDVRLVVGSAKAATLIPAAALQARNADGAYLVQLLRLDGTLEERPVSIGVRDGTRVQIVHGLAPGDTVVLPARAARSPAPIPALPGFGGPS